jgi:phosphoribosylformylglycinamidine cyclo-ligase
VLPDHLGALIDRGSWTPAPIFGLVAAVGPVATPDLEATLNMGVGMVAVVAPQDADEALRHLRARGLPAWVAGEVGPGSGTAQLVGVHPEG